MNQNQNNQSRGTDVVVTGRVVWGDMKPKNKKVFGTQMDQINPKTGEPIVEYSFGLAVPKASPQSPQNEVVNLQTIWNAIHNEAAKLGVQQGQANFAWKYVDGDGRKPDGSEYPAHYKGCYVFSLVTRIPLRLTAWEGSDLKQVTADQIKCGDYVQVAINVASHGAPNAGMYLNPSYVARYAYGEAIINTPDPKTIFNAPPPMPQGGFAQPQAPSMGAGMQQQPQGFGMPQQQAPQAQPNWNVVPQNMQPQTQQMQQPQQGMQMPNGQGFTPPWGQQ